MFYFIKNTNLEPNFMLAVMLAYVFVIMFALTIHEFSHGFVAYKCGDNTAKVSGRLTLNPLAHFDTLGLICFMFIGFGWAKPVPINPLKFRNYRRNMALVSLSGIISNVVSAFLFVPFYILIFPFVEYNLFYFFVGNLFYFMIVINLSLAVFNFLPIFPLDGFNFLNTFLKYDNKFSQFMFKYGSFVLLFVIVTGIFSYVYNYTIFGLLKVFMSFWGLFI